MNPAENILYIGLTLHMMVERGRQKTNYLTYTQNLMGDSNNDLTPDVTAKHTMDRGAWRNFVVDCCAADNHSAA